jgi:hypothetical protein
MRIFTPLLSWTPDLDSLTIASCENPPPPLARLELTVPGHDQ